MATATAPVTAPGDAAEKPTRRFPPPCWTQGETVALIDAYRERWYALRRGYLRTADWDAVAAAVTSRCPDANPAKTSAQCRHKMEKLRQRYRAEKQRSLSFPSGRFFSTWFFFDNMDAMENGTPLSAAKSNQELDNRQSSDNGFRTKSLLDPNVVKLKLKPKNATKFNGDNFDFSHAIGGKNPPKFVDGKVSSDFVPTALIEYSPYLEMGSDKEEDEMNFVDGFHPKNQTGVSAAPAGFKGKNFSKTFGEVKREFEFGSVGAKAFDSSDAIPTNNPLSDDTLLPPRYRAKKFGKINRGGGLAPVEVEEESNTNGANNGFWMRVGSDKNSLPSGGRGGGRYNGNFDSGLDFRALSGFSSPLEFGVEKKGGGGGGGGGGGVKRERNPIEEMVSSIKMLGEGFVRMEKMKMEMAMEMEKNRMEMEMKRNELILNSQRQIVDAFVKGLFEVKNQKVKVTAESES